MMECQFKPIRDKTTKIGDNGPITDRQFAVSPSLTDEATGKGSTEPGRRCTECRLTVGSGAGAGLTGVKP